MTSYPIPANEDCWWLTTPTSWSRLHAIRREYLPPEDEALVESLTDGEGGWPMETAVCGRTQEWTMPGVLSRLSMPRCGHCCRRLGLKAGNGTPANEAYREARGAMVAPAMREARP